MGWVPAIPLPSDDAEAQESGYRIESAMTVASGGDVRKMAPGAGLRDALPLRTRSNYREGIRRLPLLFRALDMPAVAAVNRPAMGAGCDLACMAGIRIAGASASFADSFVQGWADPGRGRIVRRGGARVARRGAVASRAAFAMVAAQPAGLPAKFLQRETG